MKVSVLALLPVLWASPVLAQQAGHDMSTMGGMKMDDMKPAASAAPVKKKAPVKKAAPVAKKAPVVKPADPHAGHDMSGMGDMQMDAAKPAAPAASAPMAGHDMSPWVT